MPLKKLFYYSSLSCLFCYGILWLATQDSRLQKIHVLQKKSGQMVLAKPTSLFSIVWSSPSTESPYTLHADILLQQKLSYFDYVWHLPSGYQVSAGESQGRIVVPDGISSMPLEIELQVPEGIDEAVTLEIYYWQGSYKIGQTSMYFPRSAKERNIANEEKKAVLRLEQEESKTTFKIMQ